MRVIPDNTVFWHHDSDMYLWVQLAAEIQKCGIFDVWHIKFVSVTELAMCVVTSMKMSAFDVVNTPFYSVL